LDGHGLPIFINMKINWAILPYFKTKSDDKIKTHGQGFHHKPLSLMGFLCVKSLSLKSKCV